MTDLPRIDLSSEFDSTERFVELKVNNGGYLRNVGAV